MLLPDYEIKKLSEMFNMIDPFCESCSKDVISYGLTSYGYDIRLSNEFFIFHDRKSYPVDPKKFKKSEIGYKVENEKRVILPPNSFSLSRSVEKFIIPPNILGICLGKSTYARCGLIVNITPLEPSWEGFLTIELSNTTSLPLAVYPNEGIAQVVFFRSDPCEVTYFSKGGKYQKQKDEIVFPRLK